MSKTSASQSGSADIFTQLIQDFSVENAINWLRSKFSSFDSTSRGQIPLSQNNRNESNYFNKIERLGYVTNLVLNKKTPQSNKPLLVAAIEMRKELSERTSRLVQFNCAKRLLQEAVEHSPVPLSGIPSQGLFFFYDNNGRFRISLVTGQAENRRFKFNQAKRQSFFVVPDAANRTVTHRLGKKIESFEALKEAFSVEALTKEFYDALFRWYEWAIDTDTNVLFPNDPSTKIDDRKQVAEAVIRLITRLMFVWFVLQKGIIPKELFDEEALKSILKKFHPQTMAEDNYYRAILQNLFFATLNCQPNKRKFVHEYHGKSNERGVKTCYRYENEIINSADFLKLMKPVPFLNCALFDCLDTDTAEDDKNGGKEMLLDGFSSKRNRQARVPNGLFFDETDGIINLFKRFDFTVDENSPDDEDVALDPELLGKVFENLLGVFNPETQETARKATGSFYTPREIVDYMVEQSLKNYLKTKVPTVDDDRLNELFDRSKTESDLAPSFSKEEQERLQEAIYNCKILDPACGSGAFPMGALHCMVHVLSRLDPKNLVLSKRLREQYKKDSIDMVGMSQGQRNEYSKLLDARLREGSQHSDYARKLYLIENCIYGVDVQPIAAQISKLRFFISLLCDQFNFESFDSSKDQQGENYGLLALPNLEAKFVCANTLISLPIVNNADAMFSIPEVQELKEELQRNRHKIFTARTAETKQKYKKTDHDIRVKIQKTVRKALVTPNEAVIAENEALLAELTKQREAVAAPKIERHRELVGADLFTEGTEQWVEIDVNAFKRRDLDSRIDAARRNIEKEKQKAKRKPDAKIDQLAELVASWDPYDQNACSPFFDPEWMFNITTGFDIVIGNPPYAQVPKEQYPINIFKYSGKDPGKQNLYKLFVEIAYNLSNEKDGTICLIVQSSLLCDQSAKFTRELLLKNTTIQQVVEFPKNAPTPLGKVFKSVLQGTCIVLFTHNVPSDSNFFKLSINNDLTTISQFEFLTLAQASIIELYPFYYEIPLLKNGEPDIIAKIRANSQNLSAYRESECQGNINTVYLPQIESKRKTEAFIAKGEHIHRWMLANDSELIPCKENQQTREIFVKNQHASMILSHNVAGTTDKYRIISCPFECKKKKIVFLHTVNILIFPNSSTMKFISAILNAKITDWFFRKTSTNNHLNLYELDLIPIPNVDLKFQAPIISLVDQILVAKSADESADVSQQESQIDQLVYQLYGLTEDEIAIVEGSATNTATTPAAASKSPAPRSRSSKNKTSAGDLENEYLD